MRNGVDEIKESVAESELGEGGGAFSLQIDDLNSKNHFANGLVSGVNEVTVKDEKEEKSKQRKNAFTERTFSLPEVI